MNYRPELRLAFVMAQRASLGVLYMLVEMKEAKQGKKEALPTCHIHMYV